MSAIRTVQPRKACERCKGLKHYMGLGGIKTICDCEKYEKENGKTPKIVVDKRSKEFKKAVKEMRDKNPEMSNEKAVELLDSALKKGE